MPRESSHGIDKGKVNRCIFMLQLEFSCRLWDSSFLITFLWNFQDESSMLHSSMLVAAVWPEIPAARTRPLETLVNHLDSYKLNPWPEDCNGHRQKQRLNPSKDQAYELSGATEIKGKKIELAPEGLLCGHWDSKG